MNFMMVTIIILGIISIITAFLALYLKNLVSAVICAGAVGLIASIIYLLLAAPDVAMTEAAIGSGLTIVIFLFALSKIKEKDINSDD